jgi:hypothetical protein
LFRLRRRPRTGFINRRCCSIQSTFICSAWWCIVWPEGTPEQFRLFSSAVAHVVLQRSAVGDTVECAQAHGREHPSQYSLFTAVGTRHQASRTRPSQFISWHACLFAIERRRWPLFRVPPPQPPVPRLTNLHRGLSSKAAQERSWRSPERRGAPEAAVARAVLLRHSGCSRWEGWARRGQRRVDEM